LCALAPILAPTLVTSSVTCHLHSLGRSWKFLGPQMQNHCEAERAAHSQGWADNDADEDTSHGANGTARQKQSESGKTRAQKKFTAVRKECLTRATGAATRAVTARSTACVSSSSGEGDGDRDESEERKSSASMVVVVVVVVSCLRLWLWLHAWTIANERRIKNIKTTRSRTLTSSHFRGLSFKLSVSLG
jgi:cobalamin biosynthesis Mg chelatase CobN